ncbi:MAG: chitosanase [Desulfovibrionales bacterium]|nr:chitosanase [Desulfovibrionales bacterium]
MYLSEKQRSLVERLINAMETGRPEGDYGAISIQADGPHRMRQLSYGRAQTTEYGNLRKLVGMYIAAGGIYSAVLAPYAPRVGSDALTYDGEFRAALRAAGRGDPVMRSIQDQFFEEAYFLPALSWADDHGLAKALSLLVVYDSFIHSGGILWFLRQRFEESPPSLGGSEERWVSEYVRVRHQWLSSHQRPILRRTTYRTQAFREQIEAGNWDLEQVPVRLRSTDVYPA